jgi:AcrR family transcriptional regulator
MARTRSQDYDLKRKSILHGAAELFAQFGYSATSITMIAGACKISKALLYHYYADKEAVLFDLLFAHLEELLAAVEKVAEFPEEPVEHLYLLISVLLESYKDADAEHQVQIANLKHLAPEKQQILLAMERKLVDLFSKVIARAIPEVAEPPLLKTVTMSVFGMLNWHYLWFREGKGLSRGDYARLVTELVSAGGPRAAAKLNLSKSVHTRTSPRKLVRTK